MTETTPQPPQTSDADLHLVLNCIYAELVEIRWLLLVQTRQMHQLKAKLSASDKTAE